MGTPSRITLAVPNYNHGQYIGDMIEASLSQSRPPHEIVIVDDASTDNSLSILEKYKRKYDCIRIIKNKSNQGIFKSVNTAMHAATGDLIVVRAADDLDYPGYYEVAAGMLERYPQAGMCCGDMAFFGEDRDVFQVESLGITPEAAYLSPEQMVENLKRDPIYGHTAMMRTDLFKKIGGYDERFRWYIDGFCALVLGFRYGMCYVPQPFVYVRLTDEAYSAQCTPGEQRVVFKHIIHMLKTGFSDIKQHFLHSGALDFYGPVMHDYILQDPELVAIRREARKDFEKIPQKALEEVIERVLVKKKSSIIKAAKEKENFKISIYGAGGHSRALMPIWKRLGLPDVHSIHCSDDPPAETMLEGLPVTSINTLNDGGVDLIIMSTRSFERFMVSHCKSHLPSAKRLTFWDQTLTTL